MMKTKILNVSAICLFLMLMGAGCKKNDESTLDKTIWEISPNSKSYIMQKEMDSIEFKFCMLNEKGEPAVVFKEGENFSFYFSVKNTRKEKLYFYPDFAYDEKNNFCKAYNSSDMEIGKPFIFKGCDLIGIGAYPFNEGYKYIFEQKWVDERDSTWRWEHGYYESSHQKLLSKGSYFSEFNQSFQFKGESSLITRTLNVKINFNIQ